MRGIEQFRQSSAGEPMQAASIMAALSRLEENGHSLAALAHEARNMGTALGLYCELLGERLEDAGPGVPPALLETIFEAGFTTRIAAGAGHPEHRGVGLAVTRSIVESAGGRIRAANREPSGARFHITLPVPEC